MCFLWMLLIIFNGKDAKQIHSCGSFSSSAIYLWLQWINRTRFFTLLDLFLNHFSSCDTTKISFSGTRITRQGKVLSRQSYKYLWVSQWIKPYFIANNTVFLSGEIFGYSQDIPVEPASFSMFLRRFNSRFL